MVCWTRLSLLALLGSVACAAGAKAKEAGYGAQEQLAPTYQGQGFMTNAVYSQPIQDANQPMQVAYQQPAQGESFLATNSYDQPAPNGAQYQQQTSFVATAPAGDTAVLNQLTRAVQQQSQALTALEQEQSKLAQLQSDFTHNSLKLFERLAAKPKCKDLTPNKVTDQASCEKACKATDKAYTDGNYESWSWKAIIPFADDDTDKCVCEGEGDDMTICTNHATQATSLFALLGMAIMLLHM